MQQVSQYPIEQRRGALSLAIACAVALVVWFSWAMMQEAPADPAEQRTLEQVVVSWKCSDGTAFEAPGAPGPIPCPDGEGEAYIVARYRCPEHELIEARLRHEYNESGQLVLAAISYEPGVWIEYPQRLSCPYCGSQLIHDEPSVFERSLQRPPKNPPKREEGRQPR